MALTEQQIDEMVEAILHGTQEKYVQEMSDALIDHLVQGFTKLGDEAAPATARRDISRPSANNPQQVPRYN